MTVYEKQRKKELDFGIDCSLNPKKYQEDVENLTKMELAIQPYSRAWRWGYKKSLKRAIKLIKEDNKRKGIK